MAKYETRKQTIAGKHETLERKQRRRDKYASVPLGGGLKRAFKSDR